MKEECQKATRSDKIGFASFVYSTVHSEIMDALFNKSFLLYLKFSIIYLQKLSPEARLSITLPEWEQIKANKEANALSESLCEWAMAVQLNADWCCQWAVRAMKAWASDENARCRLSWFKKPLLVTSILFPELELIPPQWDQERLHKFRWYLYALDVLDFGPDDDPSWDGISPRPARMMMPPDNSVPWDEVKPT